MGRRLRRGEIRWYAFPHPDKKRPVLILTRDTVIDYLGEITIAPITSVIRDIPSEVYLSQDDGMQRHCVINCDHIQTVSKSRIGNLITALPYGKMTEVRRAVGFALQL